MEIQDIQRVLDTFIQRVELPESAYNITTNSDNTFIEFNISIGDELQYCLSIDNGSLRVLYGDDYTSQNYLKQTFTSPITLLYELCIIFYSAIHDISDMEFNDLLSVLLVNEITNWKELACALSENLGIDCHTENDTVVIGDVNITYDNWFRKLQFGENEITIEENTYTALVEATFKVVEYVANILGRADALFDETNVIEEEIEPIPEEPEENMSVGSDIDVDVDMDVPDMDSLIEDDFDETESVEPMDNIDFSEPQGAVITPQDVM